MGTSVCHVRFVDGVEMFVGYQNTSDVVGTKLCIDSAEVLGYVDLCDCEPEPVEVYCPYGGGFYWSGFACKKHMCYLGPYVEYDYAADYNGTKSCPVMKVTSGEPDWMQ